MSDIWWCSFFSLPNLFQSFDNRVLVIRRLLVVSRTQTQESVHAALPSRIQLSHNIRNEKHFRLLQFQGGCDFPITLNLRFGPSCRIEIVVNKLCEIALLCVCEQELLGQYAPGGKNRNPEPCRLPALKRGQNVRENLRLQSSLAISLFPDFSLQ